MRESNSPGPASASRGAKTAPRAVCRAREMDGRVTKGLLYIPSFAFAYSSGLTADCAVNPPQSAVRVVVP